MTAHSLRWPPVRWPLVLALLAATLVSACAPGQIQRTPTQSRITATLLTDGNTVRVNGQLARSGTAIRQGDRVRTGPGSSAMIMFSDRTKVQLDENTDPVSFRWGGGRLDVRMDDGFIEFVKGLATDTINVFGALADVFTESHFIIEERRSRSFRIDLFSGRVGFLRPADGRAVQPGGYALVTPDRRIEFGRTSPKRERRLRQRFDRWDFSRVERTRMPNLIELSLSDALREIERAGLRRGTVSGPASGSREVTGQQPMAGAQIDRGSRVNLTVRPVVTTVRVPNLAKMSLRAARATIEKNGLRTGRLTGAQSGDRYVVNQRPAAGTAVQPASRIDLDLRARVVATILVPDVRKLSLPDAIKKLESAGLSVGKISGSRSGDAVFVYGQFPNPRTKVPRGSRIDLVVQGVIQ